MIQNLLKELRFTFRYYYAPKCFLRQHFTSLIVNKQRMSSLIEDKLQQFMYQPRLAETVQK